MKRNIICLVLILLFFPVFVLASGNNLDIYDLSVLSNIKKQKVFVELDEKAINNISDTYVKDNTAVILRSVGERTEDVSLQVLYDFFGKDNVIVIKNVYPLRSVIDLSFSKGIKMNKKWTLIVDSDTIFIKERMINYLKIAELLSQKYDDVFCVNGYVLSKFQKEPIVNGVNLYNTKYLADARRYLKSSRGIRLEKDVKALMTSKEKKYCYHLYYLVGITDFYQYYKDILKKSVILCSKWDKEYLKTFWLSDKKDKDFQMALEGYSIVNEKKEQLYTNYGSVDSKFLESYVNSVIKNKKIKIPRQGKLHFKSVNRFLKSLYQFDTDVIRINRRLSY